MNVRVTLSIKLLNTRKVKNHSLLREEEDMTTSRKDSEDRRSQSSRRKPRLLRRSLLNLSVLSARTKDCYALVELSLSSLMKKRRHNKKNLQFIFLNIILC